LLNPALPFFAGEMSNTISRVEEKKRHEKWRCNLIKEGESVMPEVVRGGRRGFDGVGA
jgi:hypothetical protein